MDENELWLKRLALVLARMRFGADVDLLDKDLRPVMGIKTIAEICASICSCNNRASPSFLSGTSKTKRASDR